MALITRGNIADNAVADEKVRLDNDQFLRGRNAADTADINILKVNATDVPEAGGDISMGGFGLTNLVDPVGSQDAATMNYVDSAVGSAIQPNGSVPFSADQSMGNNKLTDVADPTLAQDAATKNYVDTTGGGGGGAPIFLPLSGNSMVPVVENNCEVYLAEAGLSQDLFAEVWVPASYSVGSQIKMYVPWYSPDVLGTGLVQTVATLIRKGVDAASSTTNQRTSTNAAVNLATGPLVDKMQEAIADLTDATGLINGVAVSAGDNIIVQLLRGTDTATSDIRVKVKGVGVTFNG